MHVICADKSAKPFNQKTKLFVEDVTTGKFYRTDKPGLWKRFKKSFQRKNVSVWHMAR